MYESKDKMVSHPSHYQGANGMEVIDVIENFTVELKGKEATLTGQIIKYILRWKKKNGLQDLEKTMWYLQRLIEYVRSSEESSIAAEELMDGCYIPTNHRGKPGNRCKGCIYDGETCSNPKLCICDSNGNYTGYTAGVEDLIYNQTHRLIVFSSEKQAMYVVSEARKQLKKKGYVTLAFIEGAIGQYHMFLSKSTSYTETHGWTTNTFEDGSLDLEPNCPTLLLPRETLVVIEKEKGKSNEK